MSTPSLPRLLAAAAASVSLACAAAPAAHALEVKTSTLNLSASAPILGNVTDGVQGLVGGLVGATTKSTCELTGNATLCTLQVLSYGIATDYVKPNQQHVVKVTGGVINLPTLVDATGDGLPDLTVTIQALNTSSIKMTVQRLLTAPATMPVSVEALVNDPSTPGRVINVGYDARATKAPKTWTAQASLTTGTTTTVDATIGVTQAPPSMAVVGGLYTQGPGGARLNPKQARLNYTPVPASSKLGFSVGPAASTGLVSAATPTKAELELLLLDGTSGKHVRGTLDKLHQPVGVRIDKVDGQGQPTDGLTGDPHVRLTTQQDVDQARLTYETLIDGLPLQRVRVKAGPLPAQTDFTQTADGFRADTTSPVDVSGGVATGVPAEDGDPAVPVPADFPLEREEDSYVQQDTTGGVGSTTFRVAGVEHVAVATTAVDDKPKVQIGARLAAAPLHVLLTKDDGTRYDVDIADVPHNLSVGIAFGQKRLLDFCGSKTDEADPCSDAAQAQPAGIGAIVVHDSHAPEPLFGKATHLEGRIDDVPSTLGVDVETHVPAPGDPDQNTQVRIDTTRPLGKTVLRATDGSPAPADPADDGLVYVDTDDAYALVAKVHGFRRAHLQTAPVELELRAAGGHDFTFDIDMPGRRLDGALPGRPARTKVSLDAPEGQPTVLKLSGATAAGAIQGTPKLLLDLDQDEVIFGRAKRLKADVDDLPPSVTLTIDAQTPEGGVGDTKVHIDADHAIGRVLVRASDGGGTPDAPQDNGLVYVDDEQGFALVAKVHGFRRARLDQGDLLALELRAAGGHDFSYDVRQPTRTIEGSLQDRPATSKATLTLKGKPTVLTVDGEDGAGTPVVTPRVLLDLEQDEPVFGEATKLHADVKGIPAGLALTIDAQPAAKEGENTKVHIDANRPIGQVLVRATDGQAPPADPADNGLVYQDTKDGFAVVAKVDGFEHASLDTVPALDLALETAGGHDFFYDVDLDDLHVDGDMPGRPAKTRVKLTRTPGEPSVLTVKGATSINTPATTPKVLLNLQQTEPLFKTADHLQAEVTGIPPLVHLTIDANAPGDPTKVHVDADEPIGRVLLRATDGQAPPADPADNGLVYQEQPGKPFAVVAKIDGFRRAHLDTVPKLDVTLSAEGGHDLSYAIGLPPSGGKPAKDITGVVEDRPAVTHVRFASPQDGPLSVQVTGASTEGVPQATPRVTLDASGLSDQADDPIHHVAVDLHDVPPVLGLTKQPGGEDDGLDLVVSTGGGGDTLGEAKVTLDNGTFPAQDEIPGLPADGGGAIVITGGDVFFVHARVKHLREISVKTKPNLEAALDVAQPQDFRLYMDTGVGADHTVNEDGCDDFEAEQHNKPHVERHDVQIKALQPGTTFSYKTGETNGDPCKGWRTLEYTADGNADSITYDTSAGDISHLTAVIGQADGSPLKVPRHLKACQASSAECFKQIGRDHDCNLGDYCSTRSAHQSVYFEGYGEKTRLQLDVCLKNKDPQNFATCTRPGVDKGIFVKLTAAHLDAGYRYVRGFGFLTTNTQKHTADGKHDDGPNVGANGFVRVINHFGAAEYINLNLGYEDRVGPEWDAPSTRFDNSHGVVAFAAPLVGTHSGSADCVDPAYGPYFDSTQSWFHVILNTAGNDEDWLGDNLTNLLCGAF